jgi:isopenicillin N synthase-like dioxygenase
MDIPVLDLRDTLHPSERTLSAWRGAATTVGCLTLTQHGIPLHVIEACATAAREFHGHHQDWKQRVALPKSLGNKGYLPADLRQADATTNRVVRDYASLDFGPELVGDPTSVESILLGPNRWPDLAGFRSAVDDFYRSVQLCAESVSRMLGRACGLDPDHIAVRSRRGCSLLRLLHYPEPARDLSGEPNGHTDYEWLTIIWQSSEGLEFLGRDGRCRTVAASPGTVTVLIGDLLEVLTGGFLESTLHWVRSREPDRYSLTFFYGPDFDEVIAPVGGYRTGPTTLYPAVHAGNHLTGLRVRHLAHLRAAVSDGSLQLPFPLPANNPLKTAKVRRLASRMGQETQ